MPKESKIIFFILAFGLLFLSQNTFATTINLRIETPTTTILDSEITLPENCQITPTNTTTTYTFAGDRAICALSSAKESGKIEEFSIIDFGWGLWLDSINGLKTSPDWSQTWIIRKNFALSPVGIGDLTLSTGDELLLSFGPWPSYPLRISFATTTLYLGVTTTLKAQICYEDPNAFSGQCEWQDFSSTTVFKIGQNSIESQNGQIEFNPQATGTILIWAEAQGFTRSKKIEFQVSEKPTPPTPSGGGIVFFVPQIKIFDLERAIQFLSFNQNPDGSFSNPIFTDWSAIAFGAYNLNHPTAQKLKDYLLSDPDPGPSLGSPVLSSIRRAMALMSLGINPYSGTKTNYISKILESFDGEQLGDKNLFNDDIFGLLVLVKAGYSEKDEILKKITKFILSKQNSDGSFGGLDLTAAAIQSLSLVKGIEGVSLALEKAEIYLKNQQREDGGYGNPDSTSWAMQAISALGKDWKTWQKYGKTPGDYLALKQREDGSIDSPNPIWSTAYSIPAFLGKDWGKILKDFSKEEKTQIKEENREIEKENLGKIKESLEKLKEEMGLLEKNLIALKSKKQVEIKKEKEVSVPKEEVSKKAYQPEESQTVKTKERSLAQISKNSKFLLFDIIFQFFQKIGENFFKIFQFLQNLIFRR
jgi:hypothetical protein